ncbi:MAG TPA: ABC transporter substrate-binding protein [Acidimicrobiia bacterium]
MKRGILMLTVLGLILTACASDDTGGDGGGESCAKEDLNLVTPGVLTIATGEPAFPPWVGTTDGEAFDQPESGIGFEAALAYEIADGLGFTNEEVTWVRTDFNEAIAVGPKTFDFNLQQYSITAERDEVVDFSEPYYVTNQALVGLSDSPVASATSIADLKAYNLGAQIGTTSFEYIEEVIQPDTPASAYDTNADAKSAIDAGQLDAIVFDLPTAYFVTAVELEGVQIIGVLPAEEDKADQFGLLFEDGNPLKACVDAVIVDLRAEGTLDSLAEEWLAGASDIPILSK